MDWVNYDLMLPSTRPAPLTSEALALMNGITQGVIGAEVFCLDMMNTIGLHKVQSR